MPGLICCELCFRHTQLLAGRMWSSSRPCSAVLTWRYFVDVPLCTAGHTYRPNVVRVGSELSGVNAAVKDRLVRRRVAAGWRVGGCLDDL